MGATVQSEKTKMLAGELYDPTDEELQAYRHRAHGLCRDLAAAVTADESHQFLRELFGAQVPATVVVTPPFFCDYGFNVELGENIYFNTNCVLLDTCRIFIGRNTLLGPGVHIYTVNHPMDPVLRRSGQEFGKPVVIEEDVWIGGSSVICPGTTIGARTVVGAGSVVTTSLPADVFAAGNPCRVIRHL